MIAKDLKHRQPLKTMDKVIIIGHDYASGFGTNFIINIATLVGIIAVLFVFVAYKSKRMEQPTKCGCGKSESGLCDNSHAINKEDNNTST